MPSIRALRRFGIIEYASNQAFSKERSKGLDSTISNWPVMYRIWSEILQKNQPQVTQFMLLSSCGSIVVLYSLVSKVTFWQSKRYALSFFVKKPLLLWPKKIYSMIVYPKKVLFPNSVKTLAPLQSIVYVYIIVDYGHTWWWWPNIHCVLSISLGIREAFIVALTTHFDRVDLICCLTSCWYSVKRPHFIGTVK